MSSVLTDNDKYLLAISEFILRSPLTRLAVTEAGIQRFRRGIQPGLHVGEDCSELSEARDAAAYRPAVVGQELGHRTVLPLSVSAVMHRPTVRHLQFFRRSGG